MFLKPCRRRAKGKRKRYVYWQLVESVRTAAGSRHRVVAYLGELSASEKRGWARLARLLDGQAAEKAEQLRLFDRTGAAEEEPVPDEIEVRLKGVAVERMRDFGEVYLALLLWRMLGLDECLERHVSAGKEAVPWPVMAAIVTVARFVEPGSELHMGETWYGRTALADLLGMSREEVNESRLYRTLDAILPLKKEIEAHLKGRLGALFALEYDLFLYDVTSTYFEGEAAGNPQAQRGYSRDHRPDCKQVCVALVVTREGYPLGYEVFDGNRTDVTTVGEIVTTMEEQYGKAERVWVMDRGMVSAATLALLRAEGRRYLVGTPKAQLKAVAGELTATEGWETLPSGVEVRRVRSPDGEETWVVCRSASRRAKEAAIHGRFLERIERRLTALAAGLARARKRREGSEVERRIGRILAENRRAAQAVRVEVKECPERPSGLVVEWSRDPGWTAWAKASEGCYVLRTNLAGETAGSLWRMYMQLTEAEAAFRTGKSDLAIRPIWHQIERRVQGHILFSFLAYALWKTLEGWMERAGLGRGSVRTLVDEVRRVKACDVVLPTSTGRSVRVRCVTRPEAPLAALLDRLDLVLPERLGRPTWVPAPKPVGAHVV